MSATVQRISALAACLLAGIVAVSWHPETRAAEPKDPKALAARPDQPEAKISTSWDQKTAAAYRDQRAAGCIASPQAARDHAPFCVSRHTPVPYPIPRPALRRPLPGEAPSAYARGRPDNVAKRVR